MGRGYVVCLALGLAGLGLLYLAQTRFEERRQPDGWFAGAFGLLLTAGSGALIAPMQREVARARDRAAREAAAPAEPWTWDPAWTDPRGIMQAERRHGRALRIFAVGALVISSPAMWAVRDEVRRGNHLAWLALIFPLVSGGILTVAAHDAWRRRKYGTARFVPVARPVALGGEVVGMVIVNRPVVPIGVGRVTIDCWSTRVARNGGERTQQEEVVSHTEREVPTTDWSLTAGESRLIVELPLRGGSASTMLPTEVDRPAFEWRLHVVMPTAGADFVADFVLPVFDVAGAGGAGREVGTRRARARDRADVFRAVGIGEVAMPGARGGTALEFPAGVGRRLVTAPLIMTLVFGGLAAGLWLLRAPAFIAVFIGLVALVPALIVKSLWRGGGERVWLEGGEICVQRGTGPARRIAAGDVLRIESSRSVGVGAQQFYRIVACTRRKQEGRFPLRVEIASLVRGDEATAETVTWLEDRLTGG